MPSPAAHMLSGLFIAAVPAIKYREYNGKFFALAAICAAAPDLDMLLVYVGVDYFNAHRTFSHSLPFVLGVIFLLWATHSLLKRLLDKSYELPYKLIAACITCHILMDLLSVDQRGPQGLMLWWPFSTIFLYPAIDLYPSAVDTNGTIPPSYSLLKIMIQEASITCIIGLPIVWAISFYSYYSQLLRKR